MEKLLEVFIKKGLPMMGIEELESAAREWSGTTGGYKDIVLPNIIKLKLEKYESEY